MDTDLTGKHALVCGASRGIGAAVAIALADLGASVTLLARDRQALDAQRRALAQRNGQSHRCVNVDSGDQAALSEALGTVTMPVNILVNNSGGPKPGRAADASVDEYATGFRHHILANQTLLGACLPGMRSSGYGRIINIISTSVREPIPGLGVSNTIRAAVAGWAKTLSRELGPDGITVNNVLPGFTETERLRAIFENRSANSGATLDSVIAQARAEVPLGRFATPAEIAAAVAFLAGPAAAYINGVSLAVDGGRTRSL